MVSRWLSTKLRASRSVFAFIFSSLILILLFQNCGKNLSVNSDGASDHENISVQFGTSKLNFPESPDSMYLLGNTVVNQEQFNEEVHKRQTHQLGSQSKGSRSLKGTNDWPYLRLGFITTHQGRVDFTTNEREHLISSLMKSCRDLYSISKIQCFDLDNVSKVPTDTALVWVSSENRDDHSKICTIPDSNRLSSCASLGRNTRDHDGEQFGWISVLKEDLDRQDVILRLVENLIGVHQVGTNGPQLSATAANNILPIPQGGFSPRIPTNRCTVGDTNKQGALDWCPAGYMRSFSAYAYYKYICIQKQNSRWGEWSLLESGFDVSACQKLTNNTSPDYQPIQQPLSTPSPEPTQVPIKRRLPIPEASTNDQQQTTEPAPNSRTEERLPVPENAKPPVDAKSGKCRQNDSSTQRNFMPCPAGYSGQGMPASVVYKYTCNKVVGSNSLKWVLSESYFDISGCTKN